MNWFIPKQFSDRPRERAVAAIFIKSFLVVVFGFSLALIWSFYFGTLNKTIEWVLISGIIIISVLLFEFRTSGSWHNLGYGLLLPGAIAVSLGAWQTGGIKSPILIWLMLAPALAFATIGQKFGILITGIINLIVIGFFAYELIYVESTQEIHHDPILIFITLIFVMNLLVIISSFLRKEKILDMRELKAVTKAKNKVFEIIGHDLRGPVGRMSVALDLLTRSEEGLTDEDRTNLTNDLKRSSKSTFHLLENLLYWARSEQEHFLISPDHLNLRTSLEEIMNLFGGQAIDKKIVIKIIVDPTIQVYSDPTALALILRNLISNAIKFTAEKGNIQIEASEQQGMIIVLVKDSGIGMGPEVLDKIFEAKNYDSKRGTDNEIGSGLGLKIVRKFVELNGGKVSVESEEGTGSCFKFSLPKS